MEGKWITKVEVLISKCKEVKECTYEDCMMKRSNTNFNHGIRMWLSLIWYKDRWNNRYKFRICSLVGYRILSWGSKD